MSTPLAGPDPALLETGASWITRLAAPILSLAILAVVAARMARFDFTGTWALLPTSFAFWLVYAAFYLSPPVADWIIFRRLWKLPAAGFVALLRKLVGNELLVGYAGELYLYGWARKRIGMVGAPFGTIKDVAILSAVVGNVATLLMMIVAWPVLRTLALGHDGPAFAVSIGVVLAISAAAMLWRKRLFTLPRPDLAFVVVVHAARTVATTGLAALMWHLALPTVPLGTWLLLAALRLLISRLPFVANKDLIFAGLALVVMGQDRPVAQLVALIAGITVATHVVLGALLAAAELAGWLRRA
ncbi:hypothetical protein ACFO0A_01825 [Novosphingobium tardum]|uniref:Flippase-like domain-containing protein n=1 Tax=Novosphingobium tardum TaxID=1538021 RepID=A0ABV8RNE2_9SPHN